MDAITATYSTYALRRVGIMRIFGGANGFMAIRFGGICWRWGARYSVFVISYVYLIRFSECAATARHFFCSIDHCRYCQLSGAYRIELNLVAGRLNFRFTLSKPISKQMQIQKSRCKHRRSGHKHAQAHRHTHSPHVHKIHAHNTQNERMKMKN